MTSGSHLIIAKMVYRFISENTDFKLHWPSFAYGNIRPDIDKTYIDCPHTMEGSLDIIDAYARKLAQSRISTEEFSMGLGVICHFICDYFCLHHGKRYWKKNKLAHGIYEVQLDMKLLKSYVNGDIRLNCRCKLERSIKDLVIKIHKRYIREPKGQITDINYAIAAAALVCQMMISCRKGYKENVQNKVLYSNNC